jgi:hypothetical protein
VETITNKLDQAEETMSKIEENAGELLHSGGNKICYFDHDI